MGVDCSLLWVLASCFEDTEIALGAWRSASLGRLNAEVKISDCSSSKSNVRRLLALASRPIVVVCPLVLVRYGIGLSRGTSPCSVRPRDLLPRS